VNGNGGYGPLTTLARLRFQNPDRSCPSSNDTNEKPGFHHVRRTEPSGQVNLLKNVTFQELAVGGIVLVEEQLHSYDEVEGAVTV
jgi:hypothetical protein